MHTYWAQFSREELDSMQGIETSQNIDEMQEYREVFESFRPLEEIFEELYGEY